SGQWPARDTWRDPHDQHRTVRQWQDGDQWRRHLLRGPRVLEDRSAEGRGAARLRQLVTRGLEACRRPAGAGVAEEDAADAQDTPSHRTAARNVDGLLAKSIDRLLREVLALDVAADILR